MDKNRTEGTKHEIKGAVKEVVGKVTGNKAKEVAGTLGNKAGKAQGAMGKAVPEPASHGPDDQSGATRGR